MTKIRKLIGTSAAIAILLLLTGPAAAAPPQSVTGTLLELETESDGEAQNLKMSMAPDRLRLDVGEQMSLVSLGGGDGGRLLMIQHAEKSYIEITPEMMQMMAGMMGRIPDQVQGQAGDTSAPIFTRTGNTKQVGEWAAYEVLVEHPDQDGETMMWFSQDLDADFRGLAEQMVSSLSSIFNNPMMRGMTGGGSSPTEILRQVQSQMNAVDIPDGFPVQIVSDAGGSPSTATLRSIDQNANFGAETWAAPTGYQKMDLPFRR